MSNIHPVSLETVDAATRERLEAVRSALGVLPNAFTTMANSPAALRGYLDFTGALNQGVLSPDFRTQLSLAVAQANDCQYCQAAFSTIGAMTGLSPAAIENARRAQAAQAKTDIGLKFARALVVQNGKIEPAMIERVKTNGYTDGEIMEIVAHVAANTFINTVNLVAGTEIDFDAAPPLPS